MFYKKFTYLNLLLIFILGCSTNEIIDPGDVETRRVEISKSYRSIEVENTFEITLVQDSLSYALVTCGEKLQQDVSIMVKDSILFLKNNLNLHFLKGYDKVKVELHLNEIPITNIRKPSKIQTAGVFRTPTFYLVDWNSFTDCSVNLEVDNLILSISGSNFGSYHVEGKAISASLFCEGTALFDLANMSIDSCCVSHDGLNDVFLHVNRYLSATFTSKGNVYYSGEPICLVSGDGSGRLIKVN